MKKIYSLLFLILSFFTAIAQDDVGVVSITSPVSGCNLSSTETVTISITNFGSTDLSGVPFDVQFQVDGGPATIETCTFGSFLPSTTAFFTFTGTANVSAFGAHTIDAATLMVIPIDVNNANNAGPQLAITNFQPTNGGSVTADATVCSGANSGTLTLAGEIGTVNQWEYSIDGGFTWIPIVNTSNSQTYTSLTVTTMYRAQVQNGLCTIANSSAATITVDSAPLGGAVTADATVCSGTNSGTLTLAGHSGTIVRWQSSIDNGVTWINIVNATTTQNYTNLTQTTWYRAEISSGVCPNVFSTIAVITVDPVSVGGWVTANATVCSGTNSGTLTLAGHTGTILRWEFSTDGGTTWNTISNTTTTQNYTNLTLTTMYRAVVQSGVCASANSAVATITVSSVSVGGAVTANATVCSGSNSGTLTLAGYSGTIVRWQSSTDNGVTWTNIVNLGTTQNYLNLTVTTWYRAEVQNAPCASAFSSFAIITVNPVSIGGTVNSNATACSGSNSGTLTLTGHTGTVVRWEFSIDGGSTWNSIVNATTSQTYSNLTQTTLYRAIVQSGVCAATQSSSATITVSPVSLGGTVTSNATVCSGSNSGTLTLSGHVGTILNWQFSTDGGLTWTNIVNTTTTQTYTNLTVTTMYRANVQSGVCPSAAASPATITVTPVSVGGTVSTSATVCAPTNSGTLTLAGHTGTIIRWEFSTDGGSTYIQISNNTTTQNFNNLLVTTMYRAVVQNSPCSLANSVPATITVTPASVGGTVSSSATVCSGINSGTLTLSGHLGSVTNWQQSTDGGVTWTNIVNTTTSHTYTNITVTTMYRAVVQNGGCATANSSAVTITVSPTSVGGAVTSNATVCASANSGVLTLAGHTGSVIRWEFSTDGGVTWNSISNTTTTQNYANLTATRMYRAVVQSSPCVSANSAAATITVSPATVGGTVTANATVCLGSNSGSVTLSGNVGAVLNWQQSTDGGVTWTNIVNTTTSQTYTNLITTTMYRAQVQSSPCSVQNSSAVTITVVPGPIGGSVTTSSAVCSGANSGTLNLVGNTGTITAWEFSTDGGITWVPISNTTSSQGYLNLTVTTMYRARVTNNICPPIPSAAATITVTPQTVAGSISANATVCTGANSGTITLTGNTGSVLDWEQSIDNGITWTTLTNTTTSQTYTNLTVTTWYHAIIQNGGCLVDTTNNVIITVDPATVAGAITTSDTVCSGSNNGTLTLAGHVGSVIRWEYSTDGGVTWLPIFNITTTQVYNNLMQTTMYQAIVQSGVCSQLAATAATITVDAMPNAGNITSTTNAACAGVNNGVLTTTGYSGTIADWLISTDNGITWNSTGNTDDTLQFANLNDTTIWMVVAQNGTCPNDTSAAITVIIYPLPVTAFTANDTCLGNVTFYTNTSSVATGSITNNFWDFGDNTFSQTISPAHTYNLAGIYSVLLTVTTNNGCTDTALAMVTIHALPSSVITSSSGLFSFCFGDSITLSAPSGGVDYLWNTTDTVQSIVVDSSGTYSVMVTDTITGCTSSTQVTVLEHPQIVVTLTNDTSISLGSTIALMAGGGNAYSWLPLIVTDPASPITNATPVTNTTFTVYVTDANGCVVSDSVVITVVEDYNFIISNLMTPNGDGFNDNFYIKNIEYYPDNELSIFNRNGQEVFKTDSYKNNWDGNFSGQELPDGTYYYVLKMVKDNKIFKGSITILRNK
jgi:gliding motility-associated-like protein